MKHEGRRWNLTPHGEARARDIIRRLYLGDRSVTRDEWRWLRAADYRYLQPFDWPSSRLWDLYERLKALNLRVCWEERARWPAVNHHLWRVAALYAGGDCFLAGFPGAVPHQRLFPDYAHIGETRHRVLGWREPRREPPPLLTWSVEVTNPEWSCESLTVYTLAAPTAREAEAEAVCEACVEFGGTASDYEAEAELA